MWRPFSQKVSYNAFCTHMYCICVCVHACIYYTMYNILQVYAHTHVQVRTPIVTLLKQSIGELYTESTTISLATKDISHRQTKCLGRVAISRIPM